jgi:adenylate cyclase
MHPLIAHTWDWLIRFLLKRIILVLVLLFCIGAGLAMANMSHLSARLIEVQAVQDLSQHAQALNQAIDLYSSAAVDRAKTVPGVTVTHNYLNYSGGIPLPSTFAIELGDRISEQDSQMSARLYSDYPFPWRKDRGGPRDAFEKEALQYLRQNPGKKFSRLEKQGEHTVLRYGEASIMRQTCVACHNTHSDSPKKDWEVGDVGGVWEINEDLDDFMQRVGSELRSTFAMLGGISILGLSGLSLVVGKLRQSNRELEGRIKERTVDLEQANDDLGKRNQLIRQVFGRYLSDEIVMNLLEHPEGLKLGGERCKVTILTSDLRGFTALSERLQPEEVINILNLYLEHMADVINQYQGTIDEFMGDGILVLFGAPITRSDDAVRAIACACAMQLAMGAVNERLKAMNVPPLEMGVGINTGEVIAGNIGSEKRTKYGIVGSHVNLTYRIESYTKGGQVLISEETLREAGPSVKINGKKQVQPKGLKQPINIYDVYGVSGLFNIYLPKEDEQFFSVPNAVPLQYALLDGKHMTDTQVRGRLVKLSVKGAEIEIDRPDQNKPPSELTNLKINLLRLDSSARMSEDMYAKVVEVRSDDRFSIHFTSVPPTLQTWLNTLYQSIQ